MRKIFRLSACRMWFLGSRIRSLIPVFFIFLLLHLSGCATLKECAKGVAGISTKAVEESRKNALIKVIDKDYFTCFTKSLDVLKQIDAYVYAKDIKNRMIAIYVSEQDTTAVGIFFKEIDAGHTQIEVASPSTYAKEFISAKLFSGLQKAVVPEAK